MQVAGHVAQIHWHASQQSLRGVPQVSRTANNALCICQIGCGISLRNVVCLQPSARVLVQTGTAGAVHCAHRHYFRRCCRARAELRQLPRAAITEGDQASEGGHESGRVTFLPRHTTLFDEVFSIACLS